MGEKVPEGRLRGIRLGSWSSCTVGKAEENRPGHRIAAYVGKAALKARALQTLRDCPASPNRAKRLECVRFIAAFPRAPSGHRFMVPTHRQKLKGHEPQ